MNRRTILALALASTLAAPVSNLYAHGGMQPQAGQAQARTILADGDDEKKDDQKLMLADGDDEKKDDQKLMLADGDDEKKDPKSELAG